MKKNFRWLLIVTIAFTSCERWGDTNLPEETVGYVPIYGNDPAAKQVTAELPRPTIKGGKIFTTGKLLFQVEPDSGIHIINYTDPAHPQKIGFIRSFLCKEISFKSGFIYTNNFSDLVVIDISDISHVKEVGRVENVFPDLALQYPPKDQNGATIYFECPDPAKGVITGWKQQTIKNPKCWR